MSPGSCNALTMPYTAPHYLVTFSGTMGSPVSEIWQTTCRLARFSGSSTVTEPGRVTFLNSVWTAATTFHAVAALGASTNAPLTAVKIAQIGVDGKYTPATEVPTIKTGSVNGSGSQTHAFTQALVLSLRTIRPRGRAAFGRMYWPALAIGIGADGLIATGTQSSVLAAAKTFLDAINTAAVTMDAGLKLAVMSELGTGTTEAVTKVGIGREPDYISRRKSKTVETPTFSALA